MTKGYLIHRVAYLLLTFFIVITLNFFLPRLVPGNPAATVLYSKYQYLPPGDLQIMEAQLNLKGSLFHQYENYLVALFHGNLGVSFYNFPEPVSSIILQHLPWTLALLGSATLTAVFIGLAFGSFMGWRNNTRSETILSSAAITLTSTPYFWLGIIFQSIFGIMLIVNGQHLFPVSGGYSYTVTPGPNINFILNAIWHAILPFSTLTLVIFSGYALIMRNTVVSVLGEDYVYSSIVMGLTEDRIKNYVNRNSRLPVTTTIALSLGHLVAGSFLIETVFSYPGIGYILFEAVTEGDYPVIQGIFLIITITMLLANFFADIIYSYIDPRVVLK